MANPAIANSPSLSTQAAPVCWLNGKLVAPEHASVSVFDHGLLYGDGVFEGIRFYNGTAFRLQAHLERLLLSARAIALDIPYAMEALKQAVLETIAAAPEQNGYLRMVVTRGPGPLGIDPSRCHSPQVFIIADRLQLVSERVRSEGAKVIIAATRRLGADGLDPRIKSLNYLNHILARMEATHAGADEAILLNSAGRIAEGSADNIFIVKKDELLTPPVIEGALDGITRQVVLELAENLGIKFRETPLAPYDLFTADECFLTGTGAELIPVGRADGRVIPQCPGPIYQRVSTAFKELVKREN
ncbi:branched-chain-amino-acid transaminase [Cellvibrio mixtus]|uniref:branched-chain-amino-acid transaminase n=1 Tax=Cellvibrio mixtus TaxID=39650 RepID=UPI00069364D1|nr:branched-chain-amino-acid transaminase [Cellvibrio mixtus]